MLIFEMLRNISKVLFLTLFIVIAISLILLFLPKETAKGIVKEDGIIEIMLVILYIIGAVICFSYRFIKIWDEGFKAGYLMTILALRELDFQVKFTDISITRTKFYFSPDISLTPKILGGIVVFSILFVLIIFALKNLPTLIDGVKDRKIWSILTLSGLIFVALAMIIDRSLTILSLMGVEDTIRMELEKSFFEEMAELAIPALFFMALITYGISMLKNKKICPLRKGL